MAHSPHWDDLCAIIDANFPKGHCPDRGRALVALAQIEMMLQGIPMKTIFNGTPMH